MTAQVLAIGQPRPMVEATSQRSAVAQMLRTIADQLEGTEWGEPELARGALVLRLSHQEPLIFGLGPDAHSSQVYMDFHAGAQQLMAMSSPERLI